MQLVAYNGPVSLKHSILVLLDRSPGSGYDLVQSFRQGIGNFWNASHQQVYRELAKLLKEKLVDCEIKKQSDKPDRKVYRLTAGGRKALRQWMAAPAKPPRVNDALLIKVFGGAHAGAGELLAELERHRGFHEKKLAKYHEMEQQFQTLPQAAQGPYLLPYLTLRRGILNEEGWLQWEQEVRTALTVQTRRRN